MASASRAISRRSAASSTSPPGASGARPIQKVERGLGVPLGLEDRTREGDLAGEARVERSQIRLPEQADGVRFVIGDVGKRTARKRPLGLDHRVAFEQ